MTLERAFMVHCSRMWYADVCSLSSAVHMLGDYKSRHQADPWELPKRRVAVLGHLMSFRNDEPQPHFRGHQSGENLGIQVRDLPQPKNTTGQPSLRVPGLTDLQARDLKPCTG